MDKAKAIAGLDFFKRAKSPNSLLYLANELFFFIFNNKKTDQIAKLEII
jgi:hypothetical protein